jgi:hypothetical protein
MAEKVGWIGGSASTEARDIGGCAIAYPPYISPEFLVFYNRHSGVRYYMLGYISDSASTIVGFTDKWYICNFHFP